MKEITSMGGIAMNAEANGLKKEIGLLFALSLVIGTIIGSAFYEARQRAFLFRKRTNRSFRLASRRNLDACRRADHR